jgi:hypothetical protein
MNVKANCVVSGSVKRGCVVQDAEVRGATWTRRLVTSRMSGIEKLGGTDRNYVKVSAGGRWCRNRRMTRCTIQRCFKSLPACLPACSLHIWMWCRRWYEVRQVAVCLQFSLSFSQDFKFLCKCKCLKFARASSDRQPMLQNVLVEGLRPITSVCPCLSNYWLSECVPRREHHLSRL